MKYTMLSLRKLFCEPLFENTVTNLNTSTYLAMSKNNFFRNECILKVL